MPPSAADLCSALDAVPWIAARAPRLVLSLDYDGTLTPIVAHPSDAVLSSEMRSAVREAAASFPLVAVLSGRDRPEVERLVGLPELAYVGSHGFDIAGPPGSDLRHAVGTEHLSTLDRVEQSLRARLSSCAGVLLERKRFSLAVHFRLARTGDLARIEQEVAEAVATHPGLRRSSGKAVHEIQPDLAWSKGHALLWLIEGLGLQDALAIHVGDDRTDESVFEALGARGLGIHVGDGSCETAASLRLRNPEEVLRLLSDLVRESRRGVAQQQRQQQQQRGPSGR